MCWSWQPHRCTHFCMQEAEGAEYGYQTDNYPWHILSVWGRCLMQKVIFPPRHHRRSSDFVGVPDTCLCCYSGGTSAPHLTGAGNYLGRTTLLLLFFFFFSHLKGWLEQKACRDCMAFFIHHKETQMPPENSFLYGWPPPKMLNLNI